MSSSSIQSFDVTISVAHAGEDHVAVGKRLREIANKFVFQKEQGEGGFKHYQVRLRTRKRYYLGQFVNLFREQLWCGHISPTSTHVHNTRNFNYVLKLDGRLEGPWKDEDFTDIDMPPMTRQLAAFLQMELRPWQKQGRDNGATARRPTDHLDPRSGR